MYHCVLVNVWIRVLVKKIHGDDMMNANIVFYYMLIINISTRGART